MRYTSLKAYEKVKNSGILSVRRWQAYDTLFHHGPMTAAEMTQVAKIPGLWKRCSELKELGYVTDGERKLCSVTGEQAIAWDVTTAYPNPANLTGLLRAEPDFAEP